VASILNYQLKEDLELLISAQQWAAIKTFFKTWKSQDEMIDKVLLFGHFFLSHYLRSESPAFHRILIAKFFSDKNEYTAAPRGFSKTTVTQLCIIFSIVNKLETFVVLIEKTFNEASEVLKGVRDEFADNQKLLVVYGNLFENIETKVLERAVKNADSKGDIFINGIRLRAKGFNSSIRGLKSREWRPSKILLDDVEEDDHIDNPEQRKKYIDNYNKGVQPAVDIGGTIKMTGTILHQDSLLKNLIDSHNGEIFRAYDPADPKNTLLWPERWTFELLEAKKRDMASQGLASNAFAQEYLNDPVGDDERVFKYNWLFAHIPCPDNQELSYRVPAKRITMDQFMTMRKTKVFNGYAMIDVADVITAGSDYTGVMVVFVDQNNNRYKVHVAREKRNSKELIDLIFEIWIEWAPFGLNAIGIEKKGFADQVLPLFDEEKRRRQVYPIIQELKPMGRSKENRIKGALQGLYEMGKIYSVGRVDEKGYFKPVGDTMEGLDELYNFPASRNDDVSDAEAYQADMVLVPFGDENEATIYRDPQMDPFEIQRYESADNNTNYNAAIDDFDPFN